MFRLAVLSAAVLACAASAKERISPVEAPKRSPVPALSPALSLALSPAPLGVAVEALAPTPAAALALSPSAIARPAPAAAAESPRALEPAAQSGEAALAAWTQGAALFDRYAAAIPLAVDPAQSRAAIEAAKRGRWGVAETEAVVREAEVVFVKQGVVVERVEADGRPALRVVAAKGASALNDAAFEAKEAFGVTLDYVPSRTGGASAGYRDTERRVMLAAPHRADFHVALLHELRHAWYSSLLRRGITRLFHFQMVARAGLNVSRAAEAYARYVSLEELSNYPKTLKHMVVEISKADAARRAELEPLAVARVYQFFELLRTAAEVFETSGRIEERIGLSPRRLAPKDYEGTALPRLETLDLFRQDLPRGSLYFPSPKRARRVLGLKAAPAGVSKEAAERLRLAGEIMTPLVLELAPLAVAYRDAAQAGRWEEAGRAADKLVARVAFAEKDWLERQPSR